MNIQDILREMRDPDNPAWLAKYADIIEAEIKQAGQWWLNGTSTLLALYQAKDEIERLTMERDEARKLASDWSNEGGAEIERLKVEQAKYHELLYAVSKVAPGESRHETALRYIRLREALDDCREGGGVRFNSDGSLKEDV